ncbi:hypothetical protein MLD38_025841 [Melastoma candidum]|uniref:Uncharacterized protein n=1 Tax=Melastoma candidum TaxID=119954 RepID=A0ACB9NXK6_9MYRT|nr:hypothetical protein MLD38_025841 [Melastoma candidum]
MGCCISKTTSPKHHRPSPPRPSPLYYAGPSPPQPFSRPIPSPPPLPFEEESVKEVLISEISPLPPHSPPTPTVPVPDSLPSLPAGPQPSSPPQLRLPQTPRKRDDAETDILISKLEQAADVVSEYSDLYTMSGSLSVSTTATTITERKDSEVTSKASRPPVTRSSPGKPPRKRAPLVVGGEERGARGVSPPARRVQQASPERGRRGVVVGQGRDPGGGVRRNAGPGRRESVEISSRRSSSPAQGRAGEGFRGGGVGKSPCRRMTGSSGNRSSGSGMSNGSNPVSLKDPAEGEEEEDELSSPSGAREVDEGDVVVSGEEDVHDDKVRAGNDNTNGRESLENPHVSLECFIFL